MMRWRPREISRRCAAHVALAGAFWTLASAAMSQEAAIQSGDIKDGAVAVHWSYAPTGAGAGKLDITLKDAGSGAPLALDVREVGAWVQKRRALLPDSRPNCVEQVKARLATNFGQRADIEVNTYRIVTLNDDGSLVVINPFVGLNNAKMESIVELGEKPVDQGFSIEGQEFWVLLGSGKLVAVDARERRIVRRVDLPTDASARQIALDAGGRALWVSLPGRNTVGRIDLTKPDVSLVEFPAGAARLAPMEASSPAGVLLLHDTGDVSWRDGSGAPHSWRLGVRPVSAAWSPLARRALVATEDGSVYWIDPATDAPVERHARLDHGLHEIKLFDNGRFLFALGAGHASVIDVATARVVKTMRAPDEAARLVLTNSFVYAVVAETGHGAMWSIADLRAGREQPVDVLLGRADPDSPQDGMRLAVASADGAGLLVASRADATLYQYSEGMMAPTGGYSNYSRKPIAIAILDMSLKQTAPGEFSTQLRHVHGGRYELMVAGVEPRFSACAQLTLAEIPGDAVAQTTRTQAQLITTETLAEEGGVKSTAVRLRLSKNMAGAVPASITGVSDAVLLVFDRLRGWQTRAPLRETAPGEYEARVQPPRPGRYALNVLSVETGVDAVAGHLGDVQLGGDP